MSTTTTTEAPKVETTTTTTQPAAPAPKPAETVAPVVAPVVARDEDTAPDADPKWLGKRLERAEKALATKLGVASMDEAKRIIDANAAKQDAEKGEIQKLTEKAAKLTATEQQNAALSAALEDHAKEAMKSLTADQRAAVKALAEDDPAAQLKTIRTLRPTWAAPVSGAPVEDAAAPADATVAPVVEKPVATPPKRAVVPPTTTTVAPAGTPAPGAAPGQPDHIRNMEYWDSVNPVKAAAYYAAHAREIDAARAAARQAAAQ